jgi:Domain of unknown function (DUF5666)
MLLVAIVPKFAAATSYLRTAAGGVFQPTLSKCWTSGGRHCKAMNLVTVQKPRSLFPEVVLLSLIVTFFSASRLFAQQAAPTPRVLGTVQSINGNSLTVLSDAGAAATVSIEDGTKLLQIEPGKSDLKEATPLALSDLQPGDRVLVRGLMADDGKTLRAASLIAMKKSAISDKQNKERLEWQHGVGGLVKSVDLAAQTVVLTTNSFSSNKELVLHLSKDTVLRRYAPDSTRFDAAKLAPLSAVQTGDQLRARGSRSADGGSFDAAEIVSGTFRNVAGTVASIDAGSNSVVVQDLATKSAVTLKITAESQMRKLPSQFAERLAARLKGQSAEAPASQGGAAAAPAQRQQPSDQSTGSNGAGNRAGGDLQQMLARMPAATLVDLQKGDAVMVVSTQGTEKDAPAVVTLLAGVEAILRASPKGGQDMILSPWTLGGGEPSGN